MKFKTKYNLLLIKKWFDTGFGLTNPFKYVLVIFGWASSDVRSTIILSAIWVLLCFVIGWAWLRFGWLLVEQEIMNRYNLFVKQMRRKFGKPNK